MEGHIDRTYFGPLTADMGGKEVLVTGIFRLLSILNVYVKRIYSVSEQRPYTNLSSHAEKILFAKTCKMESNLNMAVLKLKAKHEGLS